ncbi:MAG: 50S ribosomal protein L10 [archaeon]
MTSHSKPWKIAQAKELKELIEKFPVVAVVDLNAFPADLFQVIRKKLNKEVVIRVSKKRVILKVLQESKVKDKLNEFVSGSTALIFTNLNPFELFSLIKKNKGNTAAKAGFIAKNDIIIPAGDTGLPPGPALSDLKKAGLKVKIQGATIEIAEDKVVTKAGEPVSVDVANVLTKLDIKPVEVFMDVKVVLEKDEIFKSEVLNIDSEQVFNDFVSAAQNALNLAVEVSYFTSQTTPILISKAVNNARNLAVNAGIYTKESIELFLSKGNSQALALKVLIKEPEKAEPKEKAEEKPVEEKPVEQEEKQE